MTQGTSDLNYQSWITNLNINCSVTVPFFYLKCIKVCLFLFKSCELIVVALRDIIVYEGLLGTFYCLHLFIFLHVIEKQAIILDCVYFIIELECFSTYFQNNNTILRLEDIFRFSFTFVSCRSESSFISLAIVYFYFIL